MLLPSVFGENLFDDWFQFPDFRSLDRADRKLYGRHADRVTRTDVRELDDHFELDVDLPGFNKEDIGLELHDGYLTVKAEKKLNNEEKKEGKFIRHERYFGSMQRSFFVGESLTEEDVKAAFKDGVLQVQVPKKEEKKLPEKKLIAIE